MKSILAASLLTLSIVSSQASSEELPFEANLACAIGASYVEEIMVEDYERDDIELLGQICAEAYSSSKDPELYSWFANEKPVRGTVRLGCDFGIGIGSGYFIPGAHENVESDGTNYDYIKFVNKHIPYAKVLQFCTDITVGILEKNKSKNPE